MVENNEWKVLIIVVRYIKKNKFIQLEFMFIFIFASAPWFIPDQN